MHFPDELTKEIFYFVEVVDLFKNIQFLSSNHYSVIHSQQFLFELYKLNVNSSEQFSETKNYLNFFQLHFSFFLGQNNLKKTNLIQKYSINENFDNLLRQHFRGIQIHSKILNTGSGPLFQYLYPPFVDHFFTLIENQQNSKDMKLIKIYLEFLDVKGKEDRFLWHITNQKGFYPIQTVSFFGSISVFQLFVELGANPKSPEIFYGQNCLHIACGRRNHEIIEYILMNSLVDVNELDNDGFSPLHIAIIKKDAITVKLLLKFGADKDVVGKISTPRNMVNNSTQEIMNLFK
jgi:hypothetical protein